MASENISDVWHPSAATMKAANRPKRRRLKWTEKVFVGIAGTILFVEIELGLLLTCSIGEFNAVTVLMGKLMGLDILPDGGCF